MRYFFVVCLRTDAKKPAERAFFIHPVRILDLNFASIFCCLESL